MFNQHYTPTPSYLRSPKIQSQKTQTFASLSPKSSDSLLDKLKTKRRQLDHMALQLQQTLNSIKNGSKIVRDYGQASLVFPNQQTPSFLKTPKAFCQGSKNLLPTPSTANTIMSVRQNHFRKQKPTSPSEYSTQAYINSMETLKVMGIQKIKSQTSLRSMMGSPMKPPSRVTAGTHNRGSTYFISAEELLTSSKHSRCTENTFGRKDQVIQENSKRVSIRIAQKCGMPTIEKSRSSIMNECESAANQSSGLSIMSSPEHRSEFENMKQHLEYLKEEIKYLRGKFLSHFETHHHEFLVKEVQILKNKFLEEMSNIYNNSNNS